MTQYLLHVRTTHCACGRSHTASDLFEITEITARSSKLRAVASLPPLARVDRTDLPPRFVPLCHECIDAREIPPQNYGVPLHYYGGEPAPKGATPSAPMRTEDFA